MFIQSNKTVSITYKRVYQVVLLLGILLFIVPITGFTERHALLIGISNYPDPKNRLDGPLYDVEALEAVLKNKWQFNEDKIVVLKDIQATRSNILTALSDLYSSIDFGDEIFIYFSGHGTSSFDEKQLAPLPTTTGAFIPVDISNIKTRRQLLEKVIVGKRDLQPLIAQLDKKASNVFVAIDACYSGNTVRSLFSEKDQLPDRYMSLNLSMNRAISKFETPKWKDIKKDETNKYPYKNVFYLSAASEKEVAKDISQKELKNYPTIDGKPHGAFTDALLRVLSHSIDADINKDGFITYVELKQTIIKAMRNFPQTPHSLPIPMEDTTNIYTKHIFGSEIIKVAKKYKKYEKRKLKFRIDPRLANFVGQWNAPKNVQFVNKNEDIELRKDNTDVLILSNTGDLITRLEKPNQIDVIKALNYQVWVNELVNEPFNNDFNIDIAFTNHSRGSIAFESETIGYSYRSDEQAYILVVNIDPNGTINVIFPDATDKIELKNAQESYDNPGFTKVVPPFGRDYFQVYAFKSYSKYLDALRAQKITLGSEQQKIFESLIRDKNIKKARATLELITVGAETLKRKL